jgi:hypothetical protein
MSDSSTENSSIDRFSSLSKGFWILDLPMWDRIPKSLHLVKRPSMLSPWISGSCMSTLRSSRASMKMSSRRLKKRRRTSLKSCSTKGRTRLNKKKSASHDAMALFYLSRSRLSLCINSSTTSAGGEDLSLEYNFSNIFKCSFILWIDSMIFPPMSSSIFS